MKQSFIFIISLLATTFMTSCEKSGEVIDLNFLTNNEFLQSDMAQSSNITFNTDYTYSISSSCVDPTLCYYVTGEFKIDGTKILLHPKKCFESNGGAEIDFSRTAGEQECTLSDGIFKETDDSEITTYSKYLTIKTKNGIDITLGVAAFGTSVERTE